MSLNVAAQGMVELQQVAGRTAVTQCRADSPLKILTPRSPGTNGWIFTSTYGGGLVDGDAIELEVIAGAHTRCLLTTQASTKVYRSEKVGCRQSLNVQARTGSVVVSVPDPIVCFAGANFEQRQRFDLAGDAGLLMVDWFTSGRKARGERWNFRRYLSSTEITVDQRVVLRDVLLLDTTDGPIGGQMRMGRVDCFATVAVVGRQFATLTGNLLRSIAEHPSHGSAPVIFSASAIPGGAVLRAAGSEVEEVGRWLSRSLVGVETVLGQDPWMRKI